MSTLHHPVREHLFKFMASLAVPKPPSDHVVVRGDGVAQFTQTWTVRGDQWENGLVGSWSDFDDVIEFGLLAREAGEARNVLQVTMVLEQDEALMVAVSEVESALNFERRVAADALRPLDTALDYFASCVRMRH